MTTRAQLEALVELVRKATPPDRAIEADVVELCFSQGESELHRHYGLDVYRFTSSLDAVVGLIEWELPGHTAELLRRALSDLSRRFSWHTDTQTSAEIALLPLALLAAFLSAKLSSLPEEA